MADRVRVLFFATARDAVGHGSLERVVPPEGTSLRELLDGLGGAFPRLRAVLKESRLAVNGEYARSPGQRVRPGDEVAVHPPYSGG